MNVHCPPPVSRTLKHLFSTRLPQCESLLHRCAAAKSLETTKRLHAHITTSGLKSSRLLSLLTAAYGICCHLQYARQVFDGMRKPTPVAYKAIIRMYTESGLPRRALQVFVEMHESDCCLADEYAYPFVIRACRDLVLLELGRVVHGLTVKSGVFCANFVGNSLLAMYMNCGDKDGAKNVFDVMEEKTVVSWNTMISGYFRNGNPRKALMVFEKMMDSEVEDDAATLLSVLPACGSLGDFEEGRKVHLLIKDRTIGKRVAVQNALIDMYIKCRRIKEARCVFDGMVDRDVVTWTSMINGYIASGDITHALEMCRLMQFVGVRPNEVTLASLLAMCGSLGDLKLGKCLHAWTIRQCIDCDVNVETALIDLYSKCSSFALSFRVFSGTSRKRTVPWNAMISGCIRNMLSKEAIHLFKKMLLEEVKPNHATWMSLLPAFALQSDLNNATNVHGYLVKSGFLVNPDIVTTLIDVYSKCGGLQYAHKLFNGLSVKNRDIVCWSALISGYGKHGNGEISLSLYNQMLRSGIVPNEFTFTSVLHACCHAGLVDDGLNLFNYMQRNHQESLRTYHYTCIVDLLGRGGRLRDAYRVIDEMPFEANPAVWGALLGACVIHENVELGEVAAKWLFELEPENTGNYVLLGNIYSAVGRFDDAEKVRKMMDSAGLLKATGNSVFSLT